MRNKLVSYAVGLLLWTTPAHAIEVKIEPVPLAKESVIWLVEKHDVPIVTVKMAFRDAGGSSDPKGKEGRAQLVAALLNEGAGDKDALAFHDALESKAIHVQFGVDGDLLSVEMETLKENVDDAFTLLGEALSRPRFDADAIARTKAQMHAALKQAQEDPHYLAARALDELVYQGHPYANPTEGTDAGIDALQRTDLLAYQKHYVTRANLLMTIVGDVDQNTAGKLVAKHLGGLEEQFTPQTTIPYITPAAHGQTKTLSRPQPQTMVLFAGMGINRNDPDFYAAFVLNHLLGGGTLSSKLSTQIREKRGLAYATYSALDQMDHAAAFTGAFATRNDQAGAALKILLQTLRDVANGDINQHELDEAKNYLTGAFPLTLSSNDGLAGMLLVMQRFHLGMDYLDKRNARIRAVSLKDAKRLAKRLLLPDTLAIVAVGQPKEDLIHARKWK